MEGCFWEDNEAHSHDGRELDDGIATVRGAAAQAKIARNRMAEKRIENIQDRTLRSVRPNSPAHQKSATNQSDIFPAGQWMIGTPFHGAFGRQLACPPSRFWNSERQPEYNLDRHDATLRTASTDRVAWSTRDSGLPPLQIRVTVQPTQYHCENRAAP